MEGITLMAKHEKTPEELFAEQFVKQLQPKTVEDVENGLKSIFGPIFESMLQGELTAHLGYDSNDHQPKETTNRRNGSKKKTLKSSVGEIPINAPRDRDGSFEPILVPKRKTDISGIEQKVLAMYGKGMSQRDIADIIDDIYGFRLSPQQISIITDSVVEEMTKWQERALKKMYSFMFVDCLYVSIRTEYETKKHAVYCIVAYDLDGRKDILGLWIDETENKHQWLQILDELKKQRNKEVF